MMKRPWVWGLFLVFAIGGGLLLTSGSSSATEVTDPASQTIAPPPLNLRGSNAASPPPDTTEISALFEEVVLENSQLRSQVAALKTTSSIRGQGVSDAAFSSLFDENAKLREQLAANTVDGDFDIAAYRAAALEATPPNIIECAEANEGGSQDACHLPSARRFEALNQEGITLWMTGLSGSGKSTIAKALEETLVLKYGKHVQMLDGDNVRTGLNRDLGFSPADRAESVRRVGEMACLFNGGGVITLVTLVSPYRADREAARQRHEDQGLKYLEVFMNVPLDVVQERDPKGLYAKVAAGELKGFTGVDAPYEQPLHPDVDLPNWDLELDECVRILIEKLRVEGVLDGGPSDPSGLPLPPGFTGAWLEDELIISNNKFSASSALATKRAAEDGSLPQARLNDIDVNWLHVISEGWAPPLRGFMREGVLLQALHFNSLLIDPFDDVGAKELNFQQTNWNNNEVRGRKRVLRAPIYDLSRIMRLRCQHGEYSFAGA